MKIQNPGMIALPPDVFGSGLVMPFEGHMPRLGEGVYLAPGCAVIGQAVIGARASIWFGAIVRADIAGIRVGEGSNIQDYAVLHVGDDDPCVVGSNVTVGHRAILHGCTVEDGCLIGMGSIVLNRAVIGAGSVVGAGALVTQGVVIPPGSLVIGSPAKVKRPLTEEEIAANAVFAPKYVRVAAGYRHLFE